MAAKFAQNVSGKQYIPDYSFTFDWEENFDYEGSLEWFRNNLHLPVIFGIGLYLPILYVGQKLMANREPFKLRAPLIVWNSALAIFSILGFARVLPEMLLSLNKFGFQHSICNDSYKYSRPTCFWIYLFVLSKTPELVDTLFLVLKKQKLIFLHVYHHATVLIYAWLIYMEHIAGARWFSTMNYGVHSIMYSYYALKAFPHIIRIPKSVSMLITSLQTLQMIMGTYVVAAAFYVQMSGQPCATSTNMTIAGLTIYVSYLFLFSHFFYKAYIAPSPPRAKGAADKKQA